MRTPNGVVLGVGATEPTTAAFKTGATFEVTILLILGPDRIDVGTDVAFIGKEDFERIKVVLNDVLGRVRVFTVGIKGSEHKISNGERRPFRYEYNLQLLYATRAHRGDRRH